MVKIPEQAATAWSALDGFSKASPACPRSTGARSEAMELGVLVGATCAMQDASVAKKKTGRAKKPAPRASGATSTPTGRQNVILERIEEQQRVVIEAVTSNREALERQILGLDQKLSSRIDVLEVAVRSLSTDVRKNSADILKNSADILKNSSDIRQNSADIQDLSAVVRQNSVDIQALGDKLDTKADAGQVSALAERVQALESPG